MPCECDIDAAVPKAPVYARPRVDILAACVGVLALLVLLNACAQDSRRESHRLFVARVKSTFGITPPYSLIWCDSYLDGGSVGGVLIGGARDTLEWACGPGSRRIPPTPESIRHDSARQDAWVDSVLRSVPSRVYIGVKYYREPAGRPLAVGSPAESLFIQLLWAAVGPDTVFNYSSHKLQPGPLAANIARALQRQRAGLTFLPRSRSAASSVN